METAMQVMLIDQNKCVRESLKTLLDNPRLVFVFFETAVQGLSYLETHDVQVVVSDYFLPDMDGLELLNRALILNPGIFRILMTTLVTDELMAEISVSGIDLLLEKPLSVASLDTILFNLKKEYGHNAKSGDGK